MKKILALLAVTLFLPLSVLADDVNEDELAESAGILPDHPLYFLKMWGEGIRRFLTFDEEKLAELETEFAERRLAEMVAAQKQNKTGLVDRISAEYEKAMVKVQNALHNCGLKTANRIRLTITRTFQKFNESVESGVYPETILITDNKTLELLSEYTNQTSFTPQELRDLVRELLELAGQRSTDIDEITDWTLKTEIVSLAGRLVWEARRTINPEEVLETLTDEEKIEALALKVGSSTAKHLTVLNNVLEKVPEEARQGIMNAINKSEHGYARAVIAVSNRARVEVNNSGVGELLRNREEVKEQLKNRVQEAVPRLAEKIQDRLRNLSGNTTQTGSSNQGNGCTACGNGNAE